MADPSIAELDRASAPEFVRAVSPLFEGAPRFLARLADARPFGSFDRLFDRAREIALEMPDDEQIELVNAHPPLGAPPSSVSAESFVEQGYDREVAGAPAEAIATADSERGRLAQELVELNAAYEATFGFRYCVFVAGRSRSELIPGFRAALDRSRGDELARALADVMAIAEARLNRSRTGATA